MKVQTGKNRRGIASISLRVGKRAVKRKAKVSAGFSAAGEKTTPYVANNLRAFAKTGDRRFVRCVFRKHLRPADGNLRGAPQRDRSAL